ncbi:ASPIC/UnbV domain protein [Gloeothece citriformis PCC 7424]|uniref:ASPIC/UnbV domain protein n=1 Tax=Gloeothece citriformis (strain PCC 7424) TaxID=65393 RepID=B7KAH5_GLOC7|nr:CRTAC1 family protein [Gloeothece citriformis]ACK72949.1 ASPIC/UnbV domain protein [Gloeothece citriformis PCC 7424]
MGIKFNDITQKSGLSYIAPSWGVSWGDVNGDLLPDVWINNHGYDDSLFLNQGNGTFIDATDEIFAQIPNGDTHGGDWTDFDNDGDQDLIVLTGGGAGVGSDGKKLYVNDGQKLHEQAVERGVNYSIGRGRTPLWFDFDRDGKLDLVMATYRRPDGQAPPTIFRQTNGTFQNSYDSLGLTHQGSNEAFATLSDLTGDGIAELIFDRNIYETSSTPFNNITTTFLPENGRSWRDLAVADFNNDLLPDMYLAKGGSFSDVAFNGSDTIQFALMSWTSANDRGLQFQATGNMTFDLTPWLVNLSLNNIYIGANRVNPSDYKFTLSSSDPTVQGFSYNRNSDRGLFIGYDPSSNQWSVVSNSREVKGWITSNSPITTVKQMEESSQGSDRLLINNQGKNLIDYSQQAGIDLPHTGAASVVAGDFDNDMDQDIYVLMTEAIDSQPNRLYENQGDGSFVLVPDGWGAVGHVGFGAGDVVTTADIDLDGFLDLFVSYGYWLEGFNDGPRKLYHNQGNQNHWLQIDLEGVISNQDGIGAKIVASAGGVEQLREQSGGMHLWAENHQRIHFGLGNHSIVDKLTVYWPSGIVQELENIASNQLIKIVEPSNSSVKPSDPFSPGKPSLTWGEESGVFFWREFFDTPYRLRTYGSSTTPKNYSVNLISDAPLKRATPDNLGSLDSFSTTAKSFTLNSQVTYDFDGVNFELTPGAKAFLSVTEDGVPNPKTLFVGSQKAQVVPNEKDELLGVQNAYSVPLVTPYGTPQFDAGTEKGLFLWQDDQRVWRLRATAGGETARYVGSFYSDQNFEFVTPVDIEGTFDRVDTSSGSRIDFNLIVNNQWLDGIDFRVPLGASVSLNLDPQIDENPASLLRIGEDKWAVRQVPLDLSAW